MASNRAHWLLAALAGAALLWVWSRRTRESGQLGDVIEEITVTAQRMTEKAAEVAKNAASALLPRGIRNHNPGNIVRTAERWQGMAAEQTDPRYVVFTAPEWGIRAMARVLNNYAARGLTSVRKIISTWAPATENNTAAYVLAVARALGVDADAPLDVRAKLPQLIAAIIRHENGMQPYSAEVIAEGIRRANV